MEPARQRQSPAEGGRVLVVMPAYNEASAIRDAVTDVLRYLPDVLVVDDGSTDGTATEAAAAGAEVIRLEPNQGKGAALNRGFDEAAARDYDAVITMDADGQHAAEDLPRFIEAYRDGEFPVLVGNRMADAESMPLIRRWTNRFMSWLLSRMMGQAVSDTQNGFRLYRLEALGSCRAGSRRFDAESEILLALTARGVPIGSVPVSTLYGTETSQVHPIIDTYRFFRMLYRFRRRRQSALDAEEEIR